MEDGMIIPGLLRSAVATAKFLSLANSAHAAPVFAGSYYEENLSQTCQNFPACELVFAAIPRGKVVTIKRISCHLMGPSPGVFHTVYLGVATAGAPNRLQFFSPGIPVMVDTTDVQNFNEPTNWPIRAGSRPVLGIQFSKISTTNNRDCRISGSIGPG
jgi:hypothetical protein